MSTDDSHEPEQQEGGADDEGVELACASWTLGEAQEFRDLLLAAAETAAHDHVAESLLRLASEADRLVDVKRKEWNRFSRDR